MTIPEAVRLLVQAGTLGSTGEIFILDMGDPVSIIHLARGLIEPLAGCGQVTTILKIENLHLQLT